MSAIRSLIFDVLYVIITTLAICVFMVMMPFPWYWQQSAVNVWTRIIKLVARLVLGIDIRIKGTENIPNRPVVVASKHQSAWDTGFFQSLFPRSVYVMKKELLSIPLWGWSARKVRSIAVDRAGGASALKKMLADTRARLDEGRTIIIFPEGTRIAPGAQHDFHPGIAAIYKGADVAVVPVALNSGLFWGRGTFGKKLRGTITVEFLPAIEPGEDRRAFMSRLKDQIDSATQRLEAEARAEFPHVCQRLIQR